MYKHLRLASFVIVALFLSTTVASAQNNKAKKPLFGKGMTYMAKDSSFSSKFNLRMQNLYQFDFNQATDEMSSQFLIRRFRLKWGGYAYSPKLKYKVELGMSNRDISTNNEDGNTRGGARAILDAVLKWKFAKNWELWAGQTKLPGNRERVISSANLQFVDRSRVNSRFNIDRDAGLQLRGKINLGSTAYIKPSIAISQGEGRNITSDNAGGYDYTFRLDINPTGKFKNKGDYFSSDLEREDSPKIAFGLTYDYNDGAVRQGGQLGSFVRDTTGSYAENSLAAFMADMMFKYKGFSILSEFATKTAAEDIVGLTSGYRTGSGFNFQAGYLLSSNVEFAGRYTTVRRDNDFSSLADQDIYTFGLSKYIVGHSLKVQSDISYLTGPGDIEDEIRFRAQVEMQF